jgi:O-antigen/teichoic acid export membrane protein
MNRTHAAIKTWFSSLAFTLVTTVIGFVITPFLLRALGEDRFGVTRSLTELVAYFTLICQLVTIAAIPRIAATAGVGDRDALGRTLAVLFRLYAIAIAIAVVVAVAFTPLLPRAIRVAPEVRPELFRSWWLTVLGMPLATLAFTRTLLDVAHRGYLANIAQTIQSLATSFLSIGLVWMGWGIDGIMLATLLAGAIYYAMTSALAARLYPRLVPTVVEARPTTADWQAIRTLSWPILITMICSRIGMLSDSLVLSAVRSSAAVSILFFTQRLVAVAMPIVTSIPASAWPGLVEMHNRGEWESFHRAFNELTKVVVVLGVSVAAPIIAYNHRFLSLWVGPQLDGGRALVALASFNAIAAALISLYNSVIGTTGNLVRVIGVCVASAVINLILSVSFSYRLGPVGPLLGTFFALLLVDLWAYPVQMYRLFGTPPGRLAWAAIRPLLFGVLCTAVLCVVADRHKPAGWVGLIAEMGASTLLLLTLAFALILNADERSRWQGRLLRPLLRRLPSAAAAK